MVDTGRGLDDDAVVADTVASSRGEREAAPRTGLSRRAVRLLAVLGVLLMALGSTGWWLTTRVLSADGFGDVVAKASQREEVRDYVADQATLRLARTSNFVSAARPIVTNALAAAIATPPVTEAIHDFAERAHEQIFRASGARRVNVDSAEAAITVRSALETINPALADKLPPNVLSATTTISQSSSVDVLFRVSKWVRTLYIPVLLVGLLILGLTVFRARDRVHALRVIGVAGAVAGAFLIGIGGATPAFAAVAGTNAPGRGEAVAQFIEVLLGRLVGAGKGFVVVGIALALAPGHDGGDLQHRVARVRAWVTRKRLEPRWRLAGGIALLVVAATALISPIGLMQTALVIAALGVLYVGIVICLRATGMLVTDHSITPLHKRQVFGVFAAMFLVFVLTATLAVQLVSNNTESTRANPSNQGCNGYIELCAQPLNQVIWAGSHNAMSSSAYNFLGAEHTITIPEQLNAGARFLMLDAYYGYDDDGLVRTNLAGGVDREALKAERGADAVHELDRLGALTGTADTSGEKQDMYFCHDFCELGAVPAEEIFDDIGEFLDRNLTDVVILDLEDYVKPKDIKAALVDADLFDRVWKPEPGADTLPTLYDMVATKKVEKRRRLIVMSEKHPGVYPWLLGTYTVSEETPFTFSAIADFNCDPNRGGTGKEFFILNHWLRPDGPPDPVAAGSVNSQKTLTNRLAQCIAERERVPNVVAVDFTAIGDLYKTVDRFNAAIAKRSSVTPAINRAVRRARASGELSDVDAANIEALRRLPSISDEKARALLGVAGDRLLDPTGLDDLVKEDTPTTTTTTPTEPPPEGPEETVP
jgi:hypothetical protein